jgi:glycosyltransferase involved in cell wall biosynthesis
MRNASRGAQTKLLRPLLAGASKLIGVSRFEADTFRERLGLPKERFVVIPNGAALPRPSEDEPDREGATSDDGPLIISLGRLERYKGHHRVIQAFPRVLETYPNARLRILGSGPYEAALRELVQNLGLGHRVEIGAIPPTDRTGMAALLQRAALIVLLSDYEAHPIAVMEALGLGKPVLVAETSGLQELVDEGFASGIPVDSSPTQVAQAIGKLLREPVVPAPFQLPTWEACVDRLGEEYRAAARPRLARAA